MGVRYPSSKRENKWFCYRYSFLTLAPTNCTALDARIKVGSVLG